MVAHIDLHRLDRLIGQSLVYRGIPCRVIEVLDDGPQLVLADCREGRTIQTNQYNEASRRVPRLYTVAVLNPRRDALNPSLAGLAELLA